MSQRTSVSHCLLDPTGLKEVRMVEARPGIAFVEFDTDMQSSVAMSGLQNFKIADKQMAITFAKQ